MKPMKPLKRAPALHLEVQESIKGYILENKLQPNDPLPSEGELARQLGVGRNSVREAIKALESVGVVETRRGSGVYLREFSFEPLLESLPYGLLYNLDELADLLAVRRVLELGLIEEGMAAMTPDRLAELRGVVAEMRSRAERGEQFLEEDRAFHRLLFVNLGNTLLLTLLDTFWFAFRTAVNPSDTGGDEPLSNYGDHAAILDAIEANDLDRARTALARHYTGIQVRLEKTRKVQPTTAAPRVQEETK